jgi:hypothetical protein
MNTNPLSFAVKRRAIQLFRNDVVAKRTQRHNQVMWLRARQILGNRYLLAMPVARRTKDTSRSNDPTLRCEGWHEEDDGHSSLAIESGYHAKPANMTVVASLLVPAQGVQEQASIS